jgi:hypothetical protein
MAIQLPSPEMSDTTPFIRTISQSQGIAKLKISEIPATMSNSPINVKPKSFITRQLVNEYNPFISINIPM